jgi:hypothetical protein
MREHESTMQSRIVLLRFRDSESKKSKKKHEARSQKQDAMRDINIVFSHPTFVTLHRILSTSHCGLTTSHRVFAFSLSYFPEGQHLTV